MLAGYLSVKLSLLLHKHFVNASVIIFIDQMNLIFTEQIDLDIDMDCYHEVEMNVKEGSTLVKPIIMQSIMWTGFLIDLMNISWKPIV